MNRPRRLVKGKGEGVKGKGRIKLRVASINESRRVRVLAFTLYPFTFPYSAACSFVDQAQAVERERLVNFVYELGGGGDERREAARGDDARASAQFLDHPPEDAVNESSVAVIKAGLNRRDGRVADDLAR